MINGLHAETTVFARIEDTSRLALSAGWPWFGQPGFLGTGEITLTGSRPGPFRVRVSDARRRGGTVLCRLDLYDVDRRDGVGLVLRVDIALVRELSRTRLTLTGSAATGLAAASTARNVDSRRLGNEYARSLLAEIAQCMERWLALPVGDTRDAKAGDS